MKIFSLSIFWRITTALLLSISPTIFLRAQDTTIVLQPGPDTGIDAMIYELISLNNYNNAKDFHTACVARGYWGKEYGLIKFDLSQIPEDISITNATLTLYNLCIRLPDKDSSLVWSVPVTQMKNITNESYLYRITSNWNQNEVTWNTRPSFTNINPVRLAESSRCDQNYTLNITEYIQKFHTKELENYGFIFVPKDTLFHGIANANQISISFFSSNIGDEYAQRRPKLEISYKKPLPLKVYQLITPEINGQNDFFYIESLSKFPENEVTIFNNWGTIVYNKKNYQNDWNGDNLPEGTYYYLVKIQGYNEELKGPVLIDR